MFNKLPDACKDCASYGSDFCEDCLKELSKDMPEKDRPVFDLALKNLARTIANRESKVDKPRDS